MSDILEPVPSSAPATKLEPIPYNAGGEAPRPIVEPSFTPGVEEFDGRDNDAAQRLHEQRVVAELRKTLEGMPPESITAAAAAMGGTAAAAPDAAHILNEYTPSKLEIQNPASSMPTTKFERVLHGGKGLLKPLLLAGGAVAALLFMIISSAAKGASGGGGRGGH